MKKGRRIARRTVKYGIMRDLVMAWDMDDWDVLEEEVDTLKGRDVARSSR